MDEQLLARIAFWVRQYATASEDLADSTVAAVQRALATFDGWYDDQAIADLAAEASRLSQAGQRAAEGLTQQYIVNVHSEMIDKPVPRPTISADPVRNGADPIEVYTRPITTYQRAVSTTGEETVGLERALHRADQITRSDLTLVSRDVGRKTMERLGVTRYRRVLHPELSVTGTCGLCIAASTRIYKTSELMPMHGNCRCTVIEIGSAGDPGETLNDTDLEALYRAAGDTTDGRALKRTRYKVNEHGEYGPALGRRGQPFKTPKQFGEDDPIGRAVKELEQLKPTLELLQRKAARGIDVSDAIEYQVDRIEKLTRIIDAA